MQYPHMGAHENGPILVDNKSIENIIPKCNICIPSNWASKDSKTPIKQQLFYDPYVNIAHDSKSSMCISDHTLQNFNYIMGILQNIM
jgi:hypothetical protein